MDSIATRCQHVRYISAKSSVKVVLLIIIVSALRSCRVGKRDTYTYIYILGCCHEFFVLTTVSFACR